MNNRLYEAPETHLDSMASTVRDTVAWRRREDRVCILGDGRGDRLTGRSSEWKESEAMRGR
ncbi:hypothetical protein PMAYCL1PPCAC_23450, partial [Pristionchus mayeri]